MEFREIPVASDLVEIASILKRSGFFNEEEQQVGVSLIEEFLEQGEKSLYYFQFAQENGRVLGYTCFGPIPGTKESYDLYWIAVDPDYQKRGIGGMLLLKTEKAIQTSGGKRVYIETSSSNLYIPTRSFYTNHGYQLEAQLKDYYAPSDDKLIYVKVLLSERRL
jgi:ribosomal protein S18 acetylase RimI-like enzyme